MQQIAATSRLVCTDTATRLLALILSLPSVAQIRTGLNIFVRLIAATKFCHSDNDFHMSHEAICYRKPVAAICRIVRLGLFFRTGHPIVIPVS